MPIVIGTPAVGAGDGRVTYEVGLDGVDGVDRLWFSVPEAAAGFVNPRADAAMLALLMPAMRLGRDLVVEGPVTDELAWNLARDVPAVLRGVRPELSAVDLEVRDAVPPAPAGSAVTTGYSGGIDSYATLARHHFASDVPASVRVTHLLFNNVGSHGRGERGRQLSRRRLAPIRSGASTMGLPLFDVDSNVDDLYTAPGLGFQQTHTMRNAAVAHLLSAGIRHFLYASSVPYADVAATPIFDVSFADPLLLPFLSHRSLTLQPAVTDLDRSQKTELVTHVPHSYERLDVCIESVDGTNCSRCWKCRRTMLTLDLFGALDRYRGVFDVPEDPRWKADYIRAALLRQSLPSTRSIVGMYDERVGIPRSWRLAAGARRSVASLRDGARTTARRAAHAVRPKGAGA
ncbi:hypothetical protein GCM10009819_15960 [Agromyces tropicus]|uniref:7-cyano-7-deazaguanine synthase n=1 Tax=Agromyces tropicus TaxID=555371 RepID=A0ABP5FW16_9MICO